MNLSSLTKVLLPVAITAICACSTHHRANGWYPIADYPDDSVVGEPLVTADDFENIVMFTDTFIMAGDTVTQMLIQGCVNPEKRSKWADGTERMIGKRLGFVYNDSVITAPQINVRLESGTFQIISPDTLLLKEIYRSIRRGS